MIPSHSWSLGNYLWQHLPQLRQHLLAHWISGGTALTGFSRTCFLSLVSALDTRYYDPTCGTEEREAIKALCMGEGAAVHWAQQYLMRGFPEPGKPLLPMFLKLEQLLATGTVHSLHQVACCSGRETAWIARSFPFVRCVGSDGVADLLPFLQTQWSDVPNLSFTLLRMEKPEKAPPFSTDVLLASGGLHYLDEQSLLHFFTWARGVSRFLFLSQPMDRSYAAPTAPASSPRGMLSWNHPYPRLLSAAGWGHITWEEGYVDCWPALKNFAAYAERDSGKESTALRDSETRWQ